MTSFVTLSEHISFILIPSVTIYAVYIFFEYIKVAVNKKQKQQKKEQTSNLFLFLKEHIIIDVYGSIFDDIIAATYIDTNSEEHIVLALDKNYNIIESNFFHHDLVSFFKSEFGRTLSLNHSELEQTSIEIVTQFIKEYRAKNKKKLQKEKERQNQLKLNAFLFVNLTIKKHILVLKMKYKQTHYVDDYGNIIDFGWDSELEYFCKHCLFPTIPNNRKDFEDFVSEALKKIGISYHAAINYNKNVKLANLKYPNELYDKVVEYCSPEILNEIYQSVLEEKNSDALLISDIKTGLDYEIFIEQILKNADFTVTRTPKTGDQGVDLVVQKNDKRIAIQCKYYSKPVGNKAVQEVAAGKDFYNCNSACVVSNNSFTLAARKLASNLNILLLNEDCLVEQLNFLITQK